MRRAGRIFCSNVRRQCRDLSARAPSAGQLLAHQFIEAKTPSTQEEQPPIVFLHGLLGNKRNIKTMANTLCQATGRNGLLLDITGHGDSKPAAMPNPHNVDFRRATGDIQHTVSHAATVELPQQENVSIPIVGHSLGGRLALNYATSHNNNSVQSLWLLDTVPGQLDVSVLHTLQAAESIATQTWGSRQDVAAELTTQHQLAPAIASWLATQFDLQEQTFAFSIPAAMALANDFVHHDFWSQIDQVLSSTSTTVHLVQAGNNVAWKNVELQSALQERVHDHNNFHHHILPNAGHWVHIDAPKGLQSLFLSTSGW